MKYRIVEKGGEFYPQKRPDFWPFWHRFLSIRDEAEVLYSLEQATEFLNTAVKQRFREIQDSKTKIHPYDVDKSYKSPH